jgi:hypothetical protein
LGKVAELLRPLGKDVSGKRLEERGMKLLLPFDTFLIPAPFFAGQHSALVAQSIIGWPFVVDHQVELFRPLRTLWAEMPRLTTSMCAVFHGSVAFPFLNSP